MPNYDRVGNIQYIIFWYLMLKFSLCLRSLKDYRKMFVFNEVSELF